ncbi:hypothetical protein D3C86_1702910 [compost metagenome]
MRPEGLLPGHFDIAASSEFVEPAFAFGHVLGVEHQRKSCVLRVAAGHAVAHHNFAARDTNIGMSDGGVRKLHTGRAAFFAVSVFGHFAVGDFVGEFCADSLLIEGDGLCTVSGE